MMPGTKPSEESLANKKARLSYVEELLGSEAYQTILAPFFKSEFERFDRNCRDRNLTPEKRAESIEAVDAFERLMHYLEREQKALRGELDRHAK